MLSEELRTALFKYLMTRPYQESYVLVDHLKRTLELKDDVLKSEDKVKEDAKD